MTQLRDARQNRTTKEMEKIAELEGVSVREIVSGVAKGKIVIPGNKNREKVKPTGIGEGLRTKVNANIGTSPDYSNAGEEAEKAKASVEYGADTVMDLSIGGNIAEIRRKILSSVSIPLGTVPVYQAGLEAAEEGSVVKMSSDDMFNTIREHAENGVDFTTVHCGVTLDTVESLRKKGRLMNFVSRGGSFIAAWMLHNEQENPLYDEFDYLLEIAREHDLTLSLGDGLRPGCLADASDEPQFKELFTLGELVRRSREKDVQAMVEGPGHLPMDQIEANVKLEKTICDGAPFYVLGPIVTDIAPGYDHIVGAIGGAIAARAGADFLCYVTPAEHLCLPSLQDVKEGVVASKIAAHSADLANGRDRDLDREMSKARGDFDWKKQFRIAIDPRRARKRRAERPARIDPETCSMCSDFCALKMVEEYLEEG